jgi:hypothetical protein
VGVGDGVGDQGRPENFTGHLQAATLSKQEKVYLPSLGATGGSIATITQTPHDGTSTPDHVQ